MIPIGERINGMYSDVKKAIQESDPKPVQRLAALQTEAGAKYLDVNTGTATEDKVGAMKWLVETIQATCDTPLCIDSQNLEVMKAGIALANKPPLMNSCKADIEQLDVWLPLCKEHNASLVTLCMDKEGVSQDVAKRLENAMTIIEKATEYEVPPDRLFIDPIILPINIAQEQPKYIFEAIGQILLMTDPSPHIVVGLSNVSQSTAERSLINRIMLVMLAAAGCDSAICDVLEEPLMHAWITAEMILNKQIYSDSFIKAALA